jgi:PGAP1-like protein
VPLFNALFNHTVHLNENSNVDLQIVPFVFDFREMPSAFSKIMLFDEATFASKVIQAIMKKPGFAEHRFMMIGHSMGGLVNYKSVLHVGFPLDRL